MVFFPIVAGDAELIGVIRVQNWLHFIKWLLSLIDGLPAMRASISAVIFVVVTLHTTGDIGILIAYPTVGSAIGDPFGIDFCFGAVFAHPTEPNTVSLVELMVW